MLEKLFLGE